MPSLDPRDIERALEGLDLPAARDAIHRTAADKGGINGHVVALLGDIPDGTYETREQLYAAIAEASARKRPTGPEIPASRPGTDSDPARSRGA